MHATFHTEPLAPPHSGAGRKIRRPLPAGAYGDVMDLSYITQVSARDGREWDVVPGTVRTASLATLSGRQEFIEFVAGGQRHYLDLAHLACMSEPAERPREGL